MISCHHDRIIYILHNIVLSVGPKLSGKYPCRVNLQSASPSHLNFFFSFSYRPGNDGSNPFDSFIFLFFSVFFTLARMTFKFNL